MLEVVLRRRVRSRARLTYGYEMEFNCVQRCEKGRVT
jgi:hypothetical protein